MFRQQLRRALLSLLISRSAPVSRLHPFQKHSQTIVRLPHDTARSSSVRAHRVTAIIMAWVEGIMG